ncbi:MAG: hypothetical protein Q9213_007581 [Squamulea squamosa]
MKTDKKQALAKSCNNLFLTLLYSLNLPGTSTNPIDLDSSPAIITNSTSSSSSYAMASEGKSASWTDNEEKLLLLHILAKHDIKVDHAAVGAQLGRTAEAVKQHIRKMKKDAEKGTLTARGGETATLTEGEGGVPKTPKKARAIPKQNAALATATENANGDGNGAQASGNEVAEENTPSKPAPAKKARAPRKPKLDENGEPVAKKQKTAGKATGKKVAAVEVPVAASSPLNSSEATTVEMEDASDGEGTHDKKGKYAMMHGIKEEEEEEEEGIDMEGHEDGKGDELDKKLLLTIQWACNVKGVKIPWEIVANEMGATITAGAVIQHLAKFRTRMVEQGLDVPPALTRGGNNQVAAAKAGQRDGPNKPATSRRNNKRTTKQSMANEDTDDDTAQETDGSSEPEVSATTSKRAKGTTKAKGPSRGRKATNLTHESEEEIPDMIKEEVASSTGEEHHSQSRFGVGDPMWGMGVVEERTQKRPRISDDTSSQSSDYRTKVIVLNLDPADLAKLEPNDDSNRQESVTSDHSSENHYGGDYSPMVHTSGNGAAAPTTPEEFQEPLDVDDAGFENLIGPAGMNHLESNHFLPGFDGSFPALSYDTQQNSHGNDNSILHHLPGSSGFARAAHHSLGPLPSGKLNDQISNRGGPSESGYQFGFDLGQHAAYPSYTDFLDPSSSKYTESNGIAANRPGTPRVSHQISGYDTSSLHPSQLSAQTSFVDRQQSPYSSMDSYHPTGGEFVNHPSVSLANLSETPVAMSRDPSEFGHMSSDLHQRPDTDMSWSTFFDAHDHSFGY